MSSATTVAVNVWVDGSCINNGNLNASSAIGICYGRGDSRNFSSRITGGRQTNNRAELLAILYVLCTNTSLVNIHIHSDSMYSINCITKYSDRWKLNGWLTSRGDRVESTDVIKCILLLIDRRSESSSTTVFEHVRGHKGDVNNTIADSLANSAASRIPEAGKIRFLRSLGIPF